jgi:predicted metal-dependent enzyme (double-stranded beta helix superfamily)
VGAPMLTELAGRLNDVLGHDDPAGNAEAAVLAEISALVQRQQILELLASVRDDRQMLAARAQLSYHHPLGFVSLGLLDARPRFTLRLHLWRPGSRTLEHVHNHRFGFAAALLCGGYEMQIFGLDQAGIPMTEYREQLLGRDRAADWHLEHVGDTHVHPLATLMLQPGSCYWLGAETLHRIWVPSAGLCCTLFLETAAIKPTTAVFTERGSGVAASTPRRMLSRDAYARGLDAVIGELSR